MLIIIGGLPGDRAVCRACDLPSPKLRRINSGDSVSALLAKDIAPARAVAAL